MAIEYGEKRTLDTGGWSQSIVVDGKRYRVNLSRGRRVRVAFKPRDFVGFKWFGQVLDESGRCVWSGECNKSTGVRGMLQAAGVVGLTPSQQRKEAEREAWRKAYLERFPNANVK